ncbi:unnamed protein product [Linum trigynum]|uniref:NAD(P)-binding domain-containing protein n=1 Tax=Linum trigynum TaxID=586398 RepID=A0AAV2EYB9_9ROSI
MKTMATRLVHYSSSSFPKLLPTAANRRLLSTTSEKVEGSSAQIKEPRDQQKLLVLGGNGFVGSHMCQEALAQGLSVSSLSRSGRASLPDSWAESIVWHQGDLLSPDSLKNVFNGVTSVISCVGGFGSNAHMYDINGSANMHAVTAAAEQGVKRFVYISAADFGLINKLLRGYYDGKRSTEKELMQTFPQSGVILRPGFIHGVRRVGSRNLNLSIIGAPLEKALQHAKILTKIPLVGPLFIPPVSVASVAKVAVRAATDSDFPSGILDVYDIREKGLEKLE